MHARTPSSSPPPIPSQTPTTMSTPAKPMDSPTIRSRVGRSSGKARSTTTSVASGVHALMIPARIEDTCVSPQAKSVNGIEQNSRATSAR